MKNEQRNAAHIRAMAAGLRDGMGGHADACADLMGQLANGMAAAVPRCACGDSFTADAMCANCIAAAEQEQQAEPVAAQSRFEGEKEWQPCTVAHHLLVQAHPKEWPHYETRALYTHPPSQPVARDVMMALAEAVFDECVEYADGTRFTVNLDAIVDRYAAQPPAVADRDAIRRIFMAHGFTIKEGQTDLKPYVYEAAEALLRELSPAVAVPDGYALVPIEPTPEMVSAGTESDSQFYEHAEFVYRAMLAAAPQAAPLSAALADIAAERRRQMEVEGWTPEHDEQHSEGQLEAAAASYAIDAACRAFGGAASSNPPRTWPWSQDWWKPTTARRNLVKSAALCAAAIERIDRTAQKGGA